MVAINFDANNVPDGFTPLPEGSYVVAIASSEMKMTKAGDGQYLKLKLKVLEGKYVNRTLFANLNLNNPSETAVEIAQQHLSQICKACEVMSPSDTTQLHDIPIVAHVVVQRDNRGDMSNNVRRFSSVKDLSVGKPSATQPPSPKQSEAPFESEDTPPWVQ